MPAITGVMLVQHTAQQKWKALCHILEFHMKAQSLVKEKYLHIPYWDQVNLES